MTTTAGISAEAVARVLAARNKLASMADKIPPEVDEALAELFNSMADAGLSGDTITTLAAKLAQCREALKPFSLIAGEIFARNFNRDDTVYTIRGVSQDGFPVELNLLAGAFFDARTALKGTSHEPGE